MNIQEKLLNIQSELKAPKSQYNNFGKYKYRNCEDILEALKPLLLKHKAVVTITDEIVMVGDRYYIKATAMIGDVEKQEHIQAVAYAREDDNKKGMDLSQLTGSTSSYARKYALNGLFAIDDTKDADTTNIDNSDSLNTNENKNTNTNKTTKKNLSDGQIKRLYAIAYSKNIDADTVKDQIKKRYNKEVSDLNKEEYDTVCNGYEKLKK